MKYRSEIENEEVGDKDRSTYNDDDGGNEDPDIESFTLETNSKNVEHIRKFQLSLKNHFLDRLAEALAKVKKPPKAAEHVACVYMAEKNDAQGNLFAAEK